MSSYVICQLGLKAFPGNWYISEADIVQLPFVFWEQHYLEMRAERSGIKYVNLVAYPFSFLLTYFETNSRWYTQLRPGS